MIKERANWKFIDYYYELMKQQMVDIRNSVLRSDYESAIYDYIYIFDTLNLQGYITEEEIKNIEDHIQNSFDAILDYRRVWQSRAPKKSKMFNLTKKKRDIIDNLRKIHSALMQGMDKAGMLHAKTEIPKTGEERFDEKYIDPKILEKRRRERDMGS